MSTLSYGEPGAVRLSRRPEAGRRFHSRRPSLEALEDRNLLQASPTNPAAAAAPTMVGSANPVPTTTTPATTTQTTTPTTNQTVVANNGTLAASAVSATNGTAATLVPAPFSLTPASLNNLTPIGAATPLVQTQGLQTGSPIFSGIPVNSPLPNGQPSPGVPYGFAGRIVFANTGTPQRTGLGDGAFSPPAGVVPTGLYLGSGGGDLEGGTPQPARTNPVRPVRGQVLSDAEQEGGPGAGVLPATDVSDLALEGFTGAL